VLVVDISIILFGFATDITYITNEEDDYPHPQMVAIIAIGFLLLDVHNNMVQVYVLPFSDISPTKIKERRELCSPFIRLGWPWETFFVTWRAPIINSTTFPIHGI